MLSKDVFELRNELQQRNTLFAYAGFVSESLMFSLGEAVKQQLAAQQAERAVVKRVFSVFVEQAQNIIRYSEEKEFEADPDQSRMSNGVIALGIEEGSFFVICGNAIKSAEVEKLRSRLEHVVTLDEADLRAHYKAKLREDPEEQSEGATIGLLEIARRASKPLEFGFHEMDETRQFFVLKAFI